MFEKEYERAVLCANFYIQYSKKITMGCFYSLVKVVYSYYIILTDLYVISGGLLVSGRVVVHSSLRSYAFRRLQL